MDFHDERCDVDVWVFCAFHVCRPHGGYAADAIGVEVGDVVLERGCGDSYVDVAVVTVVVRMHDVHARHGAVGVGTWHDDLRMDRCVSLCADDACELLNEGVVPAYDIGADATGEGMGPVWVLLGITVAL